MKTYVHDTYYYGGAILNTISSVLECHPSMDRGGKYVWCDSSGCIIVYCDMYENDNRGSLEVHENGKFIASIDYNGILDFNTGKDDLLFNKDKIVRFLIQYIHQD